MDLNALLKQVFDFNYDIDNALQLIDYAKNNKTNTKKVYEDLEQILIGKKKRIKLSEYLLNEEVED